MTERYTRIAFDEDTFATLTAMVDRLYAINENLNRIASVLEEARDAAKEEAERMKEEAKGE